MTAELDFLRHYTPNWPADADKETRTLIRISVQIGCDGRGLNRMQVAKICQKMERAAQGRSKTRKVSAIV